MTDIVKKNNGPLIESSPLRMLRDMLRWDPFREIAPALETASFSPSFDISESKDAFLFKADMPGVRREDLEITATGNRLQIAGKRDNQRETKQDTYYAYEREYGSFCRSFTLPEGADLEHATSDLKDGVLTLAVPKKPGAQATKIAIATGAKS